MLYLIENQYDDWYDGLDYQFITILEGPESLDPNRLYWIWDKNGEDIRNEYKNSDDSWLKAEGLAFVKWILANYPEFKEVPMQKVNIGLP